MATDRTATANYTVGDNTRCTTASTGSSATISFQDLRWICVPILNIDATASDTYTSGLRGVMVALWEGATSDDICFPQVATATGTVTFTGGNSDCDGRLYLGVKS